MFLFIFKLSVFFAVLFTLVEVVGVLVFTLDIFAEEVAVADDFTCLVDQVVA